MLTTGQSLAQVVDMTNKELAAVGGPGRILKRPARPDGGCYDILCNEMICRSYALKTVKLLRRRDRYCFFG